ncbi:hypothetical protein CARUB_v10011377mg [Capsella rubella]|uniref:Uncharacterized protein n=1 Tax=Capsella rubella TaxID=81985 RepID=R0IKD0_9BRAS|nr:hypothetical protein CARUB_v10011377mg [Capsella rubella]
MRPSLLTTSKSQSTERDLEGPPQLNFESCLGLKVKSGFATLLASYTISYLLLLYLFTSIFYQSLVLTLTHS